MRFEPEKSKQREQNMSPLNNFFATLACPDATTLLNATARVTLSSSQNLSLLQYSDCSALEGTNEWSLSIDLLLNGVEVGEE